MTPAGHDGWALQPWDAADHIRGPQTSQLWPELGMEQAAAGCPQQWLDQASGPSNQNHDAMRSTPAQLSFAFHVFQWCLVSSFIILIVRPHHDTPGHTLLLLKL